MKKQILVFIIGVLVGAIITTGVFLVLKGNQKGNRMEGKMGEPPIMDGNMTREGRPSSKSGENNTNNNQVEENNNETNT